LHNTWVPPIFIRQDPSAHLLTLVSKDTGRIWSGFRSDGRSISVPFGFALDYNRIRKICNN